MKKEVSLLLVLMFSCFTTVHAFFGFNKKAEEPKGIEYYVLSREASDLISERRISYLWTTDAENSKQYHGLTPPSIYSKFMTDELLMNEIGECESKPKFEFTSFMGIKYIHIYPQKYKTILSGIVPISFFDIDSDVDADGMFRVFVPAIKSGEVSTEQFKMQLRMNKAVKRGVISEISDGILADEEAITNTGDRIRNINTFLIHKDEDVTIPSLSFSDYAKILSSGFKNF